MSVAGLQRNAPETVTADQIAEVLLRYCHNEEYADSELQALLTVAGNGSFKGSISEDVFMHYHINYLRQVCTQALKTQAQTNMEKQYEMLEQLWNSVVLPAKLAELDLLSEQSKDELRVAFATITRAYVDMSSVLQWLLPETCGDSEIFPTKKIMIKMNEFGLREETNTILGLAIPYKIQNYVTMKWSRHYGPGTTKQVAEWVKTQLAPQVSLILGHSNEVPVEEMLSMALTALGKLRVSELFDIVEQSQQFGLEDLSHALAGSRTIRDLTVNSYIKQCNAQLLNGASDTVDIIEMYLRTIKAFSVLDPQGILLEQVGARIRVVLQERSDTTVKLAEGLFGLSTSPLAYLADEMKQQVLPRSKIRIQESFQNWVPDPIDTPADFVRKQTNDNVSTLVNLYDNKEVFIQQLAQLYGTELLNTPLDDMPTLNQLDEQYRLLCLRFGEPTMHHIGVMLQDIRQSRKAAEYIHSIKSELQNVNALVLSRLYWPPSLRSTKRKEPVEANDQRTGKFDKILEMYEQMYPHVPGQSMLGLEWLPEKGRVTVSLELEGRTLEMVVRPNQAELILAFGSEPDQTETPSKTLEELVQTTGLSENLVLDAIQFWVDHQVLGTDGEKYKVLETLADVKAQSSVQSQVVNTGDTDTSKYKSTADPYEDMHQYWSYIVGMLTNLGTLPIDRIQSFLVMFVPNEDPYIKTKQELESYLLAMTDESKLKCDDGKYSLIKK